LSYTKPLFVIMLITLLITTTLLMTTGIS